MVTPVRNALVNRTDENLISNLAHFRFVFRWGNHESDQEVHHGGRFGHSGRQRRCLPSSVSFGCPRGVFR